ncbi:DUF2922 domain-containing protein [Clostridium sp. BJN0001]|uniref:DUF2922 domain-containing protein n=1 Tax=Clostridium sp. BJN0001 TaxID=2930219 RepID=UPI001FD0D2D7|nr:DUF2922 domain-containing protein [Clostridium sp. BJN0001]
MHYTLTMTFLTTQGLKTTISVTDVKEDVTSEKVKSLMQLIIDKNVFNSSKGSLVSISSAAVTQKETTELNVK